MYSSAVKTLISHRETDFISYSFAQNTIHDFQNTLPYRPHNRMHCLRQMSQKNSTTTRTCH